jgi:hypothetical protein
VSATDPGEPARPPAPSAPGAAPTPSAPPPDPDERAASSTGAGRGFSIAGGILGLIALLVAPILVGPAGIALGYVGHRKGDRHGRTAMIVAGVGTVVGMILGVLVFASMRGG